MQWPSAWPRHSAAVWTIRIVFGLLLLVVLVTVVVVPIAFDSFGKLGLGFTTAAPVFLLVPSLVMQLMMLRTRFRKLPRAIRDGGSTTKPLFLPDVSEIASVATIAAMVVVFVPYVCAQTVQSAHAAEAIPVLWVFLAIEWVLVGALALSAVWLGWNWRTVRPRSRTARKGSRYPKRPLMICTAARAAANRRRILMADPRTRTEPLMAPTRQVRTTRKSA